MTERRIVHLSTEDLDGGAARAAYRLHSAFQLLGPETSRMAVKRKRSESDEVFVVPPLPPSPWRSRWERLRQRVPGLQPERFEAGYTFNFDAAPDVDWQSIFSFLPSESAIPYLHWMSRFLDANAISAIARRAGGPVFWVIHDLEPFTGGCHYAFGCDGYRRQCGNCPQLTPSGPDDLSRRIWLRKRAAFEGLPIHFIAPTSWGEARARESALFGERPVHRIPLPMDAETFRPLDQALAREVLRVPKEARILLFGATYLEDRRKGMPLFIEAMERLKALGEDVLLLVVGLNGSPFLSRLPFPQRYLGPLHDELMMALAYQAADVFVCPSIEDSGPMMVSESMLCGTPVAAFDLGAAADLLRNHETGYRARLGDAEELAHGIQALLRSGALREMGRRARAAAAAHHDPLTIAHRHRALWDELVSGSGKRN